MSRTLTPCRTLTAKLVLTAVLALAVFSLTTTAAPATNTVEIDSKITMPPNAPAFHGKVKSSNEACEQNRRVKLFKKKRSGGRRLLGRTLTDSAGRWAVTVDPLKSGVYRAVVKRRVEGTAGTNFVCLHDSSQRATID